MQYKHKVAIAYLFAYFLDLLNSYIANVAFPSIGKALHATVPQLTWIANAYVLSLILVIPVSGWLGDKYGTKKIFVSAVFIFTIASLLCGLSTSIYMLIFSRFLQGIGGGLLIPVGQAMLFRQFLPTERPKISAAVLIPACIAPMISPAVGGFIVEHFAWNYVFYFNIPFGMAILLFAVITLKEEKSSTHTQMDFAGLAFISMFLFLILYGCYLFSSPDSLFSGVVSLIFAFITLGLFLFHSFQKKNPLLDLTLFKNETFSIGTLLYFIIALSLAAVNILMIYFFQNVLGASPLKTGLLMVPFGIGIIIGLKLFALIGHKFAIKSVITFSLIIFIIMPLTLCFIYNLTQYNIACMIFFIYGISTGVLSNSLQNLAYLNVKNEEMGRASAIFNLNRQLGNSLGIGIFTMFFSLFLQKIHIFNTQEMLYSAKSISIFHLCFFMAGILNVFSFFVLWKWKQKEIVSQPIDVF